MKIKKRKHHSRLRGSRSAGYGFRQTHKGKGSKGGIGMSGTGKRASHKEQFGQIIARKHGFEKYFGKRGYTSAPSAKKINKVMNLDDIHKNFSGTEIRLEDYKILGEGSGFKAKIYASSASASALEKMKKAGSEIVIPTIADKGKSETKPAEKLAKIEVKAKK